MDFNFSSATVFPAKPKAAKSPSDKHEQFLNRHRRNKGKKPVKNNFAARPTTDAPKHVATIADAPKPKNYFAPRPTTDAPKRGEISEATTTDAPNHVLKSEAPVKNRGISRAPKKSPAAATETEAPASPAEHKEPVAVHAAACETDLRAKKWGADYSVATASGAWVEHPSTVAIQPPLDAGVGSRRKPMRTTEEEYATFHLSAADLSANSHRAPVASKSSTHIFDTGDFASLGIHPKLVHLLGSPRADGGLGLERPTQVQSLAITALLQGKSAYIKSQTGSGKTLAYLLPLVHCLASGPRPTRQDGTLALILAPTRELCSQISDVLVRLVQPFIWLVPGCISGGERKKSEKSRLRKGVTILVATPGRLLDHLKSTEAFRRDKLKLLVLDEVDRLMDAGFARQITECLDLLSSRGGASHLQTILASATVTDAVRGLLQGHLGDHEFLDADIGAQGQKGKDLLTAAEASSSSAAARSTGFDIPQQLAQHSMGVTYKLKLPALCATLRHCRRLNAKVLLFVSTTAAVDFFESLFASCAWPSEAGSEPSPNCAALFGGWPLFSLHGNRSQAERQATHKAFRPLKSGLLICTDVASRGLDLPGVDWIVQYDPPTEVADYVHRIGRTARKGDAGSSLLFLSPSERGFLDVLESYGLNISPLSLEATLERGFAASVPAKGKSANVTALTLHESMEAHVTRSPALHELALTAFQGFVRAYSAHSAELKAHFLVRSLHLGHVARNFALGDAPTTIKQAMPKQQKPKSPKRREEDSHKFQPGKQAKRPKNSHSYEVGKGADSI